MHGDKYGEDIHDGVVVDMHRVPRFGHTSDFAKLFSSNDIERKDYTTGILAFASFVVFFFLLWAGHLLVLKIKGKERVGCAAGQVYQQDASMDAEQRATRRESRLRCVFVLCLLAILTACAVLLGSAVPTALDATAMLSDLTIDVQTNIYEGMAISQTASRAQDQLDEVDLDVLVNATTYCPRVTPEGEDGDLFDILSKIENSMDNVATTQAQIHSYTATAEQGGGINDDLGSLLNVTMQIQRYLDAANDYDYTVKLFVLVLVVLCSFLIYGLIALRCNRSSIGTQRFLAYIIIPLFTLVVLTGAVFTGAASSVAIMNADYCSGGIYPGSAEGTMEAVLIELGHTPGNIIYDAFDFYKGGCLNGNNPFDFIKEDAEDVTALSAASAVESYIENIGIDVANEMCGEDIRPLLKSSQQLTEALQTASDGLRRSIDFTSCSRVRPIYRRVFYGPTCQESVQGLTNIFASLVVISFFGMMLLSVRASLYTRDTPYPNENTEKNEFDKEVQKEDEYEQYKKYMAQYPVYDEYLGKDLAKKSNANDRKGSGLDGLALATSTFETDSHEPGESWDEEETPRANSNLYAESPSAAMARNEEELEPLSPPDRFAFTSPSAEERTTRPKTACSC